MKSLTILLPLLIAAFLVAAAWADTCSKEFNCNEAKEPYRITSQGCSPAFGGFPELENKTQVLAIKHLEASMKYLLYASHFASWKTDRPGFSGYFSKMSDAAFDHAVTIIKHMSKRGGKLSNFKVESSSEGNYEVSEIEALAEVLDIEKGLATETIQVIHSTAAGSKGHSRSADGELAHFLAEEIAEKHADRVHDLAVHVNNLGDAVNKSLSDGKDLSFLIYLYDTQFM